MSLKRFIIIMLSAIVVTVSIQLAKEYFVCEIEVVTKEIKSLEREQVRIANSVVSLNDLEIEDDKEIGVHINDLLYKITLNDNNYDEANNRLKSLNTYLSWCDYFIDNYLIISIVVVIILT